MQHNNKHGKSDEHSAAQSQRAIENICIVYQMFQILTVECLILDKSASCYIDITHKRGIGLISLYTNKVQIYSSNVLF